jgi:hypothetical protein
MRIGQKMTDENGTAVHCSLNEYPDKCPICSKNGQPQFLVGCIDTTTHSCYAVFRCPVSKCRGLYTGFYKISKTVTMNWDGDLTKIMLARHTDEKPFPKNITEISPSFCQIFNQAHLAEENGLNQICGPGYRKALEFLMKDFLILHKFKGDEEKKGEIDKSFLGKVIQNFIDDERIKQCAKRAIWLGNDETHYVRKWEDKDLKDLKSLILLTVNFTDSSVEADRYLTDMIEGK